MNAHIICIGDEILIGQTINTNAAWLGEKLNLIGIRVRRCTAIGDDETEILSILDEASEHSQVVIITGGLGPTKDDITKKALCKYFDTPLVLNDEALLRITEFFSRRNLPMLEVNNQQAALPAACEVIHNYKGTACGMWFEKSGTVFISMPGVPYEMEAMMDQEVLGKLGQFFKTPSIIHRTVLTCGVGESFLADKIADWENSLEIDKIKLAYLPSPGMVKLRMSIYGGASDAQREVISRKESELLDLIGPYVFGYEKDTLQEMIGKLLRARKETVAIAESCTGGYIAHLMTSIPGSSDYFSGGVVTYATETKVGILGVDNEIIKKFGVVSKEVAESMAEKARIKFGTVYAISTTGIAGPDGGTSEIPVGTVWIGLAGPGGIKSAIFKWGKSREFNIPMASNSALNMLRKEILSQFS